MNLDVNELCMTQIIGYKDYFQSQGYKVNIRIYATDMFLKDNPHMTNAIHQFPGNDISFGYTVLSIHDSAVRNLHRDGNYLVFDCRRNGTPYQMRVILGDIFGIGPADEVIMLDPSIVLATGPNGSLILRPWSSIDRATGEMAGPSTETPIQPEVKRPTLTIVK